MAALQKDLVITVNENDEWTGTMEKLKAHEEGILHRALSVFVLNSKGELLLQRRAMEKYHSGGLWTNTCCSHPAPGESTIAAAHRRLVDEMGFDCELAPLFHLRYRADVGGLIENEYDHIYLGYYDGHVAPNPEEVMDQQYMDIFRIQEWMKNEPDAFTPWFHLAMPKLADSLDKESKRD